MLVVTPAQNQDVVVGKWLLTLSSQVLASNSIFGLVLHYIVVEVILQKKTLITEENVSLRLVC